MNEVKLLLSGKTKLENYAKAAETFGALVTAEYLPEVSTEFDGLILCGGSDIHPHYYHEEIDGSVNIDTERDRVEFALLDAFVKVGKPVLGICRGFQLINVYFGGLLHQDIAEANLHKRSADGDSVHTVSGCEGGVLNLLYGPQFAVNSAHHQAVKRLGDGLFATARWNDRYIEGFEHSSLPIYAVQWHPERMCLSHKRADTVDGSEIFRHFIGVCKEKQNKKNS